MRPTQMDLYQLTSLVPHHAAGHSDDPVVMTWFSRRLPRDPASGKPVRGALVYAGLSRCLDHLQRARFEVDELLRLRAHPLLGPALNAHPELVERLADWRFTGSIRAPREGTPLFAGPAIQLDGTPLDVHGVRPAAYCPYLEIETDLLTAKLIETPLLSLINHMTMVASKAAVVARAARAQGPARVVLEFGTRRTHPDAAVDAALAAYIGGCAATSNVAAHLDHDVPMSGTMDHFAIQAWEQPDQPRHLTERAYFEAFAKLYGDKSVLLVDTYDTYGAHTGIRSAVAACPPDGPAGVRLDSALSRDNIWRARRLLDSLGAQRTRIYASGGMDEHVIAQLGDAPVDGYGIGERIVTSPDAPVGVGAVAKLALVRERPTMKLSRGSGKATLPGRLQVWRTEERDVVGLAHESREGRPLLQTVWTRRDGRLPAPDVHEVRDYAASQLAALAPERIEPRTLHIPVSDGLAQLVRELVPESL